MPLSLRKLTRQPRTAEELDSLYVELKEVEDRAAAILGAIFVEDALEEAIVSKMAPLNERERRELFDGDAPLATFSAKIRIGYAIKIYQARMRNDLAHIKNIRNAFAHARKPIKFVTPAVAHICSQLVILRDLDASIFDLPADRVWPPNEPRDQYVTTCNVLELSLRLEAPNEKARPA